MATVRMSADERRRSILDAAITEFARSGYAGTSTESIASRAGISQPYLFRLFGTKKELFIETNRLVGEKIIEALTKAGEGLVGDELLMAKGAAYMELVQQPGILQVQLHGFAAACSDEDIAATCRDTFQVLSNIISDQMGIDDETKRQFFSSGMMLSVMMAINLLSIDEPWAQSFCPDAGKSEMLRNASILLHETGADQGEMEISA